MDLTFGTFLEWQRLQCKEIYDEQYSQTPIKPTMVEDDELETLFDSYAELPIDFEEFFDAQTIEAVENDSSWDVLKLDDIFISLALWSIARAQTRLISMIQLHSWSRQA
jgi:hypothetical protein